MAEVVSAREGGVPSLNGRDTSRKAGNRAERNRRRDYKREYQALKKSTERMPVTREKEMHSNLYTGAVSRPNDAKKHLLYQTRTMDELKAAEYVWNHPESLRGGRLSVLGSTKDMSNPQEAKKVNEKRARGVVDYRSYSLKYKGKNYVVKTENIGNDYERIYHLHKK